MQVPEVPRGETPEFPVDHVDEADDATAARIALRSRGMTLLTVAWALTNVSDSILMLILAVWVKDLTGSDGAAGMIFVAFGAPALVSPLLGHVADRVSRRRMLIVAYGLGAVFVCALFAVQGAGQLWVIYLVTVAYSAVGFATSAAQSGLLRDLLPDAAIAAGNGRLTTIDQGFRLIMPLVGAGVYTMVGPRPLIAGAAAAFVAAATVLTRMSLAESGALTETGALTDAQPGLMTQVAAGFRHLRRTPPLGGLTTALVVAFSAGGLLNAVIFAVIDRGLGLPPVATGPITSVEALFAVVAGLGAARLIRRWGTVRIVTVGLAMIAIGFVPMAGASLVAVVAGIGLVGAGITLAIVAFTTERQLRTPPNLQGRAAAATSAAINVPQLLVTALGASLVGMVDYRLMIALTTLGIVVAAFLAGRSGRLTPPQARRGG